MATQYCAVGNLNLSFPFVVTCSALINKKLGMMEFNRESFLFDQLFRLEHNNALANTHNLRHLYLVRLLHMRSPE